jgi:hypothetical protein
MKILGSGCDKASLNGLRSRVDDGFGTCSARQPSWYMTIHDDEKVSPAIRQNVTNHKLDTMMDEARSKVTLEVILK